MAYSWTPAELNICKPLSPIWVSSSITRKRQATGFEPLCHIWQYEHEFSWNDALSCLKS